MKDHNNSSICNETPVPAEIEFSEHNDKAHFDLNDESTSLSKTTSQPCIKSDDEKSESS